MAQRSFKQKCFLNYFPLFLVLISAVLYSSEGECDDNYRYYYQGETITLTPSLRLIAVKEDENAKSLVLLEGLIRDKLSEHPALTDKGYSVFRSTINKGIKEKENSQKILSGRKWQLLHEKALRSGVEIQPVFEQGMTMLIPFDEVIVGFEDTTDLEQAKAFFAQYQSALGLLEIRYHRQNTFIIRIGGASNGRSFEVSRTLATKPGVQFAEPNYITIYNHVQSQKKDLSMLRNGAGRSLLTPLKHILSNGSENRIENSQDYELDNLSEKANPSWTTIASIDFEGNYPEGWGVGTLVPEDPNAYWGLATNRKHRGTASFYCAAQGDAGVAAPGPAPVNMRGIMRSATYDLSVYDEVFVDVWFWAENEWEIDQNTFLPKDYDFAGIGVYNGDKVHGTFLTNYYREWPDENTTIPAMDPTTQDGWMHALYRVPDSFKTQGTYFEFRYLSDDNTQKEGVYLDDIRIIGTTEIDTTPLGTDTYSARHWDKKNVGQVAGYGTDNNDLRTDEAWGLVNVSQNIIIAIVDGGVELTHPDLNLVTGYEPDGAVGGGPRGEPRDAHGTNCAGDAAAIGDNGVGVIGQAPGCKIMPVFSGGTTAENSSAIDVAVARGAQIISNSWGNVRAPSQDETNAITQALNDNRIVLFAAGNGPDRFPFYL